MFETPFAHGIIKQIVIGFGSLFSEIKIIRKDNAGVVQQTINVPLAYAPKEKWVTRTEQDPNQEGNVFTTLPRMSFEVTGYNYDTARMVNRNNQIKYTNGTNNAVVHAPVPYNIDISLYVLTKGTEDALCIVEQILPLFAPEYTLNFTAVPEMNIKQEVPIVMNSVSVQDDYEGDFQTRRLVTHTFTFTAKANLYAGVKIGSVILSTDVDLDTTTLGAGEQKHLSAGDLTTKTVTQDVWTP